MSLLALSGTNSVSGGYEIENSVKTEADNSEWMQRATGGGNDSNVKQHSISAWVKRTELGGTQMILSMANIGRVRFNSSNKIEYQFRSGRNFTTTRVFRDTSAWYHIVMIVDTTSGTAGDRLKLYVNGVRETSFSSSSNPSQNFDYAFMKDDKHVIGYNHTDSANPASMYIAEVLWLDGTAASITDLGEFDDNGIWIPVNVSSLSVGTNGCYLDFEDSSNMGNDKSGGTDFTLNNIAAADQATDTPTNNFAIANTLTGQGGFFVITEGATKGVLSTAGPGNNVGGVSLVSTLAPSSGKWYFEAQNTNSGDAYLYIGAADTGSIAYTDGYVFGGQNGTLPSIAWRGGGAYDGSAKVYSNNSATGSSVNWETEVVGVALDLDNNKIYFHKSGTWINSGDPANGTDNGGQYDLPTAKDGQWYLGVSAYNLATWLLNFGGYTTMSISSAATDANGYGTFEYAPPSGYYALCTKNLAEYG